MKSIKNEIENSTKVINSTHTTNTNIDLELASMMEDNLIMHIDTTADILNELIDNELRLVMCI